MLHHGSVGASSKNCLCHDFCGFISFTAYSRFIFYMRRWCQLDYMVYCNSKYTTSGPPHTIHLVGQRLWTEFEPFFNYFRILCNCVFFWEYLFTHLRYQMSRHSQSNDYHFYCSNLLFDFIRVTWPKTVQCKTKIDAFSLCDNNIV